jgi:hypothetical protein
MLNNASEDIANEPFLQKICGKQFTFKVVGYARAMALIAQWLKQKMVDDIRMESAAFEEGRERTDYVRERLRLIPFGTKLDAACLDALAGDDKFIESKGKEGVGPYCDIEVFKKIILRAVKGPCEGLDDLLETLKPAELSIIALRCMGIASVSSEGNPEEKKPVA